LAVESAVEVFSIAASVLRMFLRFVDCTIEGYDRRPRDGMGRLPHLSRLGASQ
jgi:hypothetical protein